MSWSILEGDCVEVMADMEENSVDAICCDPPYGLNFMNKEFDKLGRIKGYAALARSLGTRSLPRPSSRRAYACLLRDPHLSPPSLCGRGCRV